MVRATLNGLLCCLLGLLLNACVGDMAGSNPSLGGIPADVWDEDALTHRELFARPVVQDCLRQARNSPQRRDCRDRITFARMRYADIVFERYRHRLFYGAGGTNAAVDIAVLGLNSAGALVSGAATKSILAAVSGGLIGTRAIVEKEVLQNAAIPMLMIKMEEQRAAVRKRIEERLRRDESVYSFEAAEIDAGDYFRAGSLHDALIALQSDSAAALSDRKRLIDEPPTVPAPWQPSAPPPSAALETTITAPPPVAAPLRPPTPAPLPLLPPVATARSQLWAVLGAGPDGMPPPDPARVAVLRSCWTRLGKVPTNFSIWFQNADSRTLVAATDCVNNQIRSR